MRRELDLLRPLPWLLLICTPPPPPPWQAGLVLKVHRLLEDAVSMGNAQQSQLPVL